MLYGFRGRLLVWVLSAAACNNLVCGHTASGLCALYCILLYPVSRQGRKLSFDNRYAYGDDNITQLVDSKLFTTVAAQWSAYSFHSPLS